MSSFCICNITSQSHAAMATYYFIEIGVLPSDYYGLGSKVTELNVVE